MFLIKFHISPVHFVVLWTVLWLQLIMNFISLSCPSYSGWQLAGPGTVKRDCCETLKRNGSIKSYEDQCGGVKAITRNGDISYVFFLESVLITRTCLRLL